MAKRTPNTLNRIRIVIGPDLGCPITIEQHAAYCAELAQDVTAVYGVPCTCELGGIADTRVHVYGAHPLRHVEHEGVGEDQLVRAISDLAQETWERGNFWEATEVTEVTGAPAAIRAYESGEN